MTYLGCQIEPQFGYDFSQIKDIVQSAENLGFSHAWFSDHFMINANAVDTTSYECFSSMMAAASYTTKLRIGSLVFCNSYRHPSVLAKQIASLDHYSNGRIDFGYGAGWKEIEYDAYGIPFPKTGIRLKQMVEGLEVIRKLWTEEKANYEGEYYNMKDAVSFPKPLQKPMPIWLGTMYGRIKMLTLSAKYADGINFAWAYTVDDLREKLAKLDELCEKFGRDPTTLTRSYGVWTRVYKTEEEKEKTMKEIAEKRGFTLDALKERYKGAMHGTPEEIVTWIKDYKSLGINSFIFMFPQNKEIESMKIFKDKIIPHI